jgi:hypothetical protein
MDRDGIDQARRLLASAAGRVAACTHMSKLSPAEQARYIELAANSAEQAVAILRREMARPREGKAS